MGMAMAAVKEDVVEYRDGEVELEGFYAYDEEAKGPGKAVLIVHQWTGLSENERMRARMLAELGYRAFALDIYGKGIRPKPPESGTFSGIYKSDRALFRARLKAGLEKLKELSGASDAEVVAIGYCFGGTGVLEMARANFPLAGVVSFHGGLGAGAGMSASKGQIDPAILVLHGAVDPYVPEDEVSVFREEMKWAGAKMELVAYPDAVHAFTQKEAGGDPSKGAAYQAEADAKSWEAMLAFFERVLGK